MSTLRVSAVSRRPVMSGAERMKEYILDAQNPGKRRNFTVRDGQAVADTLFQRSGVIAVLTPSSTNRMAGYGTAGA